MTLATHPTFVDPRGVRFGGYLTGIIALIAAALSNVWIAAGLTLVLLASAIGGARWNVWAYAYQASAKRILGKPPYLEPAAPPRFANLLGGVFTGAGVGLVVAGLPLAGEIAIGIVSGLAFLNAAANFCVGCKLYGLLVRPKVQALRL